MGYLTDGNAPIIENIWIRSQAGHYTHLPGLKFESPKIKYRYEKKEHDCWRCRGKGVERGFIYDPRTNDHKYGDVNCRDCKGTTKVIRKELAERIPDGTETKERSLCGSSVLRPRLPKNISDTYRCPNCEYVKEFINAQI